MARTVSIVGAGRVGIALGKRLRELGWRVGAVVTRSKATSRAAVRAIGAGTPVEGSFSRAESRTLDGALAPGTVAELFRGSELQLRHKLSQRSGASAPEDNALSRLLAADVILLATPDDALASVARALAGITGANWRGKIILHTSGALDCTVLAPLARLGASTGSLHPMQTFSGTGVPRLKGVTFAIEGDPKARRVARTIARSLGGLPVDIAGRDKPAYHATAVLAGGSGFPLIEASVQILVRIGFTRRQAMQTLLPLTRQMLDNIERIGPRAAWTGPLSRGDYAVVAKHVHALRRYPPEFRKSYAALARLAAQVLSKDPAATHKQLKRALGKG
jgi:predicted short-subunit dehydrogenase-like oxidoreductase (DUF2520 family)